MEFNNKYLDQLKESDLKPVGINPDNGLVEVVELKDHSYFVGVQYHPESFTISTPKTSFDAWITQKRRHITTASHYKFLEKFLLSLFYVSQLLFFMVGIAVLAIMYKWELVLAVIGARYFVAWLAIGFSARKLREKDVAYFYPIFEMVLVCVQLSIFISNLISKPTKWK